MRYREHFSKLALSAVLGCGLMLAAGTPARADRDYNEDCHKRLDNDRARVERDSTRFGQNSSQVRRDEERMEQTRQWCRSHHADWDHDRYDKGVNPHH